MSAISTTNNRRSTAANFLFRSFTVGLNSAAAYRNAIILTPLAFGVWSVLLGADANWDLLNYHLYNPFALFNGKLATDFAPGGFQNYFNPLLDVPYYFGTMHLPPPLLGFLMGTAHGLNFVFLVEICRRVLPALPQTDKYRILLLLAFSGCLTANFLSELGNTMGDNTTSVFCLSSILIILHAWERYRTERVLSVLTLFAAGILMGMGTGLKLTNAIYAIALCAGLFAFPLSPIARVKIAFVFGVGTLVGFSSTAGYWFYIMWQTFGNPLFPQFGSIFPNDLAARISVADTSWLPKGIWQEILWPFIISIDSRKVGQIDVRQIIWAIVYALLIVLIIATLLRRQSKSHALQMDPSARYILVVIVISFVLWMKLFSIYRYLVPMELLAPLAIFILCNKLLPYDKARRVSFWAIMIATLVVFAGGIPTWGHTPWSDKPFYVDVPELSEPSRTTVLITEGDPPWSWLALAFPSKVAFTQISGNFPQGEGFLPHIKQMANQRGGPVFALFQGHRDSTADRANRKRKMADSLGLTSSQYSCEAVRWITEKFNLRVVVNPADGVTVGASCRLDFIPKRKKVVPDIESMNRIEREKAQQILTAYDFNLLPQRCSSHRAGIGDSVQIYQWCEVE